MIIAWLMEMTVYSRSMDFNQLSKIIFNSPKRLICWFQLIPLNRIRFFSFFFSLSKMKQKKNERNHCERLVDPYIFQFQCEKLKNCMQQYNLFIQSVEFEWELSRILRRHIGMLLLLLLFFASIFNSQFLIILQIVCNWCVLIVLQRLLFFFSQVFYLYLRLHHVLLLFFFFLLILMISGKMRKTKTE